MTKKLTMMEQWQACKEQAPGALLFFRLGDFYEAFYEDAHHLAKETHVTLTQRQGVPMAGIPHHNAEIYIDKLVDKGFKVAVAEQMGDPKDSKGIMERKVVRIVTPGALVNSALLSEQHNNYFAALAEQQKTFGMALIDVSTGECKSVQSAQLIELAHELVKFRPREFLLSKKFYQEHRAFFEELLFSFSFTVTEVEEWAFDAHMAFATLKDHFKVLSMEGYGLCEKDPAATAAGALLFYLKESLSLQLNHVHAILHYELGDWLRLDRTTQRNLELLVSLNDGQKKGTLLELLDHTHTPMGARLLKQWIVQPLIDVKKIDARQEAIAFLIQLPLGHLLQVLSEVRDLERLMMRVATGCASPRDLVALRNSLKAAPVILSILQGAPSQRLRELSSQFFNTEMLVGLLSAALIDDPASKISDGEVFRMGYDSVLDEWQQVGTDSKQWVSDYQARLRDETGIKTLKVGYTQAFGYFIEISKAAAQHAPDYFIRRQTLVNAERFISSELKMFEEKTLKAHDAFYQRQCELFNALIAEILPYAPAIRSLSAAIAEVDVLHSLAVVARKWHYCRPVVDKGRTLAIEEGRHPVVEAHLAGGVFTPNDLHLADIPHMVVLTGPNMAGKSTYLRQVALIALLAHMGSFVPAKMAHIGVLDQIFTRIGASDDLARGQSTFMVEMTETANILHHATERSLLVLDEIGRGTSTFDGISIAWSIAEYLLKESTKRAKVLFATHYWELTKLPEQFSGAENFHVAVAEQDGALRFLHKVLPKSMEKSYGIHVAQLAGLPQSVIVRAQELLGQLERRS